MDYKIGDYIVIHNPDPSIGSYRDTVHKVQSFSPNKSSLYPIALAEVSVKESEIRPATETEILTGKLMGVI